MLKKGLLFLCILLSFLSLKTLAAPDNIDGFEIPVDIMLNGDFIKCPNKPFIENGTTYIPVRTFSEAIGATLFWDETQNAAVLTKDSKTLTLYEEKKPALLSDEPTEFTTVMHKGVMFIPVKAISNIYGYKVEWDGTYYVVKITADGISVPEQLKDFSYTFSDMLWMARIIQIECGNQSFATRIGIGNTVMNRVKSTLYPNTVMSAILDTKHGVQYPPAHTDSFYKTPSQLSMLAGKCALNDVNLVENAVAFVNVNYLKSSWAANNMRHVTTIGIVAFYSF